MTAGSTRSSSPSSVAAQPTDAVSTHARLASLPQLPGEAATRHTAWLAPDAHQMLQS